MLSEKWRSRLRTGGRMVRFRSILRDVRKLTDWLAERGGLETSVSRETFSKENGCERCGFLVSKSASILQRMNSLSVRHSFRR